MCLDAPVVGTNASTVLPKLSSMVSHTQPKAKCEMWSTEQTGEWLKDNRLEKFMDRLALSMESLFTYNFYL